MYITGIGSRSAPTNILNLMTTIAESFPLAIWRSGGANGCDTAIEQGAQRKEIYLPWRNFNDSTSSLHLDSFHKDLIINSVDIVARHHPKFYSLKQAVQKLHMRNVFQVLGKDLKTPSKRVICWTPDGANSIQRCSIRTGGTATAIKIADTFDVPVYNLYNETDMNELFEMIKAGEM